MTSRYSTASTDSSVIEPGSTDPSSPVSVPIRARTSPPRTIWIPVATSGRLGSIARCDANNEPLDQAMGEMRTAARPRGSSAPAPPNADGPTRIATPAKPSAMLKIATRGSRSPRKIRPKIATQTGMVAMSSAVMPDGIVCSPNATMPIPPPSRSAPTMALSRHSRRLGTTKARPSRAIDHASRIRPASENRTAAIRNGGSVSTAIEIAR